MFIFNSNILKEEQNENMEKQQKQLLKHTELKRCYAEMDKEKQKVEEALVGREQLAQEVEAELKDKIANLEKELKVAKEEVGLVICYKIKENILERRRREREGGRAGSSNSSIERREGSTPREDRNLGK